MLNTTQTLILAGGRGTRMGFFCRQRAKPVLPFAGSVRVIDFTLSNCVYSLLDKAYVLTDYERDGMARYLHRWACENRQPNLLHILEPRNGSYTGTADAVFRNIDVLENDPSDTVMVLAGDHVYRMDYQKLLSFHKQTGADATISVIPVPLEEAHRFGIVSVDGRVRITGFEEKPEKPQSNLVSMGIYVFNKKTLIRRLIEDAADADSSHDFGHAVLPLMLKRDRVAAFKYGGYWKDIGTPQSYYASNMDVLPASPTLSIGGGNRVLTGNGHMPPARIYSSGRVRNSIISPGCIIEGAVENSVLSPGVYVGENAVVKNSVVMADSCIGRYSVLRNSLIGEDVMVDSTCYLGFGSAVDGGNGGITLLGDRVTVPPHTAIGLDCAIEPDTGTQAFAGKGILQPSAALIGSEGSRTGEVATCR